MRGQVITREMRRQLERDNAKQPVTLQPVPESQWPNPPGMTIRPSSVMRIRDFLVQIFDEANGTMRLSIARTSVAGNGDWQDGISWEEMQGIKRQCGLGGYYAVEVYPRDQDIVNVANMRHLWVTPTPLNIGWSPACP